MGRFSLPLAQVLTSSGRLGAGYRLHFYSTGTSSALDTYSNAALSVANSNPVVADASGTFPDIFLGNQPYKVVLATDAGVTVWSADPVSTAVGELGIPIPVASGGTGATDVAGVFTSFGLGTAATYDVGDAADEVPTNSMVSGVPTGAIVIWSGNLASVPAGWVACDGGTYSKLDGSGTITVPDLRDRFVVGATLTYAQGSTGGAVSPTTGASGALSLSCAAAGDHNHSGATDGHTLTLAQIPAHDHDATVGGNYNINNVVSANFSGSENTAGDNTTAIKPVGGGGSHSHGIQASGTHTHSVTGGDHTHTVSALPPYFALIFICRL